MQRILSFALLTMLPLFAFAQHYNLTLLGQLDYELEASDIWGYVDDNGTEYAIMGLEDGTAIISLADPYLPAEVAFIEGGNSIWRDMKSYGDYVYVTTEAADGLLVIDMSDVENGNVSHNFYQPEYNEVGFDGPLLTIHNLYIDENGFCYISGANINNGGVLIYDLNQNPTEPPLVGRAENIYSHDVYVRNDTCWSSNMNDGHFSAIDVSDKANPVVLAYQETTFNFSHNAWLSDDGRYLFTTDELPDANIDAYDVSDVGNIQLLDTWKPANTAGQGVIPHNVHVLEDYLVISYYTDGLKIVDAARPHNLVEVGSYDTYTPDGTGFFGCWGAYPFLPSGLVLASDINSGLFVFQPNYQRACYLEGTVTDAGTGLPLNNVSINLDSGVSANTPANGQYATGQVTPGDLTVTFSKAGYVSQTLPATLVNGEVTLIDVALVQDTPVNITGQVVETGSGTPIAQAMVRIEGEFAALTGYTDADGNYMFSDMFQGTYRLFAGKWGHITATFDTDITPDNPTVPTMELEVGYADPFAVDLGWTVFGDATAGEWEQGLPHGTSSDDGTAYNPNEDISGDVGDWCYVTGNGSVNSPSADDVDGGVTTLLSPIFDVADYDDPHISYHKWFANGGGNGEPNDALVISLSNGTEEVVVETITENTNGWSMLEEFRMADYLPLTATMQIKISTSDMPGSGHLVEAGFDGFKVYDGTAFQTFSGRITEASNGNPIAGAHVTLRGGDASYEAVTDDNGVYTIPHIIPETYEVNAGKWGFATTAGFSDILEGNPNIMDFALEERYEDPFALDLGWTVEGDASSGAWVREAPYFTTFNNLAYNPLFDAQDDIGSSCYVTGNGTSDPFAADVDDGTTRLVSPAFDLTGYGEAYVSYYLWFANGGGDTFPDDEMTISLSSGSETVAIQTWSTSEDKWSDKQEFRIADFITPSDNMRLIVEASDTGAPHIVEAGFDRFRLFDKAPASEEDLHPRNLMVVSPNPFREGMTIHIPPYTQGGTLRAFDGLGRMVGDWKMDSDTLRVDTHSWATGVYYLRYRSHAAKVVKH